VATDIQRHGANRDIELSGSPIVTEKKGFFWAAVDAGRELSPVGTHLAWKLLDAGDEQRPFRVQFEGRPEFCNPAGNIQGGMLAAMLDETFSPALAARLGPEEFPATLEMKVSFIEPAQVGTLIGEARIVSRGKSICFIEACLRTTGGRMVATATATARIRRTPARAPDC
jgi:uncharacterized protein (TIGR00369 family)